MAAAGIAAVGCGGGAGGRDSSAVTTSVSGSIPLDGLTSAQATQLCNDINSAATATLEPTTCAAFDHASAVLSTQMYLQDNPGTPIASLQAQCSLFLTNEEDSGCPSAMICDAATIASSSPACTATVADLVTCLNENNTIAAALLAATPACDTVTASSLNDYFATGGPFDTYNATSMSASCQALASCGTSGTVP